MITVAPVLPVLLVAPTVTLPTNSPLDEVLLTPDLCNIPVCCKELRKEAA